MGEGGFAIEAWAPTHPDPPPQKWEGGAYPSHRSPHGRRLVSPYIARLWPALDMS
jgi:hypothetical protein